MVDIVIGGVKRLLFDLYGDSGGFGNCGGVLCASCSNNLFSKLFFVNLTKSYK